MKSYTDILQSKKLAEILPLESADMHSEAKDINGDMVFVVVSGLGDKTNQNYGSPVWSLAALLGVLPKLHKLQHSENGYYCSLANYKYVTEAYNNPIDACVEMIIKLHELNLL